MTELSLLMVAWLYVLVLAPFAAAEHGDSLVQLASARVAAQSVEESNSDQGRQSIETAVRYFDKEAEILRKELGEAVYAFDVVLKRQEGDTFGFAAHLDGATIFVDSVETEGLVARWNAEHPDRAVHPGDRIVEVNGHQGDGTAMENELTSSKVLNVKVQRGEASPAHAAAVPKDEPLGARPWGQPELKEEGCSDRWAQCGGLNFMGTTCCSSGFICTEHNKYFSQCTPDLSAEDPNPDEEEAQAIRVGSNEPVVLE